MKRKTYRVDDGDHWSMLCGLLWLVAIAFVFSVLNQFCN